MLATVRRVNPQEPDGVAVRAALHDDGVAVEHFHDAIFLTDRAPFLTEPPPQHRGGGQDGDHDHGPGADHVLTLAPGYDTFAGGTGSVAGPCRDEPGGSSSP